MTKFSQLIGASSNNKKSSATNPLKTKIPGSAIRFKKKITKQGMRKIIRTTRVNGEMIDSNKLRDKLVGLVKKAGIKGLSGKQLEKKLREDYKMDIKDRKRVIKGITKYWAKPEEGLTEKQRLRIKRLNVSAYSVDRDKEYGIAESLKNKRGGKSGALRNSLVTESGEKIGYKSLGIKNINEKSKVSSIKNNTKKIGFANKAQSSGGIVNNKSNNASSVAGGFGTKLGGAKLGNLNIGGRKPLGF